MQVPVFMILMTAPVYVPRNLLEGWIDTASKYTPATAILESGRSLMAGDPFHVGLAFAAATSLVVLMIVFAVRGLRKAEAQAAQAAVAHRLLKRAASSEPPVASPAL